MMGKLLPPQEPLNAEGYCSKCGLPLGIEGRCSACAVKDLEKIRRELKDVFTCKICGQPKTHHRLYGYRCWNPEHNREKS